MSNKINRPRGTADVLPDKVSEWRRLEHAARELCEQTHVEEIRTPIFEHTELFLRGVGDGTDIVEKEMYTFEDKGGRSISLRPEGTAGVARAVLENKLYAEPLPLKLYYIGPMFRYERPAAGRVRQHHQFGVEIIGTDSPAADVEAMNLAMRFYSKIGITELSLMINSVGCHECRPKFRQALHDYLEPRLAHMCEDCNRRADKNPLRILDCKQEKCRHQLTEVPSIQDHLCEGCQAHMDQVKASLEALNIPYEVDAKLVRGLDYYTRTVFEIMVGPEGQKSTLSGGGRYNGLLNQLGGQDLPGVGFGIGLERALLGLEESGYYEKNPVERSIDLFVIPMGEAAQVAILPIIQRLREQGKIVERDFEGKGPKSGLKRATRLNAKYAILVGDDEIAQNGVQLKDLQEGTQEFLTVDELVARLG